MIYIFLSIIGSVYSQNSYSSVIIKGRVKYSEQYCMGTPPQEDDLYKNHGYDAGKFYVIKKNTDDLMMGELILTFATDRNGEFSFTVPKGEYYIYNTLINTYEIQVVHLNNTKSIPWVEWPEYDFTQEMEYNIQINLIKTCPRGPERM